MACKGSAVRSRLAPPPDLYLHRSVFHLSPSSRGLGHRPFTAVTGVRIPLGTPLLQNASLTLYLSTFRQKTTFFHAPTSYNSKNCDQPNNHKEVIPYILSQHIRNSSTPPISQTQGHPIKTMRSERGAEPLRA